MLQKFTNIFIVAVLILPPIKSFARDTDIAALLSVYAQMEASFTQQTQHMPSRSGKFWLDYPGKMRIDYDVSGQDTDTETLRGDQIIADGLMLHYYDAQLDYVSTIPLSQTPAGWMLSNQPEVLSRVVVTDDRINDQGRRALTLRDQEDPDIGSVTLFLSDKGVLDGWRVVDPLGHATDINLEGHRHIKKFAKDLFDAPTPITDQSERDRARR